MIRAFAPPTIALLLVLFATTPALAQVDPTPAEGAPHVAPSQAPPAESEPEDVPPPPPPPPPPAAPPPGEPYELRAPPRSRHIYGSLEVGYSSQTFYSVPINGLNVTGILGADFGGLEVGGLVEVIPGQTQGGLDTLSVTVAPIVEGHFDRIRLGGGLRLGGFNVNRVTNQDNLFTLTAGVFARMTVDVVNVGKDGGVFVFGKASIDSAGAALYGLSAGLGYRF